MPIEVCIYRNIDIYIERPIYIENIIEKPVPCERVVEIETVVPVEHIVEKPVCIYNIIEKRLNVLLKCMYLTNKSPRCLLKGKLKKLEKIFKQLIN